MSEKNITIGNDTRPMTAEEIAKWEQDVANIKAKDDAEAVEIQNQKDLKASAKAKLIAGEALTEEEANVLVGV